LGEEELGDTRVLTERSAVGSHLAIGREEEKQKRKRKEGKEEERNIGRKK